MKFTNIDPLFIFKLLVYCVMAVLVVQTFLIQVLNREVYQAETKTMVTHTKNIYAERGLIMDRNGIVFADNLRDSVKTEDFTRIFLQGKLASQIVGKVGYNGVGSMGLERIFDLRLRGSEGFRISIQDAKKKEIYGRSEDVAEAEPGKNLVLTIDRNMQEIVEKELKVGVSEYKARSASAVVVDPYTGEILAMASYPTFDPNSRKQGVGGMAKNDIVAMAYEPGSTFKVITASAALENGIVDTNKVFPYEGKCWAWNPKAKPICDDENDNPDMNMSLAMARSSNVVFAKVANEVGPEKMYRMARNYGIGMKTSEYFYGEESGSLKDAHTLGSNSGSDLKSMGFGHAVLATPIQMVMAYSAVANGGKLMEPMIVKEWRDSKGNLVEKNEPSEIRRVISENTAAQIRAMLRRVVNDSNGTARKYVGMKYKNAKNKLPDIEFAGKTGTAEKYNQELGKYDRQHQVASFIGLAPTENTRYVCMVIVDDPQTANHHGGNTAGPIFRHIMEDIYYHPELSPASYHMNVVEKETKCVGDYVGMLASAVKSLTDSTNCSVEFEGKGNRVIAERKALVTKDGQKVPGYVLVLGNVNAGKMPDLKGLSLKDALEIAGNIRMNVEYTGKGHVVAQSPKADEELRKGQICKLTLKEKG